MFSMEGGSRNQDLSLTAVRQHRARSVSSPGDLPRTLGMMDSLSIVVVVAIGAGIFSAVVRTRGCIGFPVSVPLASVCAEAFTSNRCGFLTVHLEKITARRD